VGGFHYGFDKANNLWSLAEGFDCVYSNEWDKYAASVYRRHYNECDERDIRTVPSQDLPSFDLLCGGFPCQPFSVAGRHGGFDDTRGTLFFEIVRILFDRQPRLVLLENVKGLLSHDGGRTFKRIISALDELGYNVQWDVLNSKDYGVPQNRERIIIVGYLRGTRRLEVFPIRRSSSEDTLARIATKVYEPFPQTHRLSDAFRIRGVDGVSATLKGLGGGMGAKTGLYAVRQPLKFLDRNQRNIEGDYSYTVDSLNTGGVRIGTKVRRLTPVECERLQGYPDDWTKFGEDGKLMSDSQRYKMMGNAVTTNVVTAVAERLV
jgi:DNA (cytosine-5)-methyltransferase 1